MPIIDSIMESVVTESMLSAAKLKISLTPILIPLITDKKKIADRNLVQRSLDKIKGVKNTHWILLVVMYLLYQGIIKKEIMLVVHRLQIAKCLIQLSFMTFNLTMLNLSNEIYQDIRISIS